MLGSHRDNAHFNRSGWKKRVMLPCWIIQILILLSLMGLFSYRLSHTVNTWEEQENKGDVPVVEFVWEVANIGFSLISLVITFISIARFIAEVLTPLPLLFGCILSLVLSGAVLALDITIYVQRKDKNYSLVGLGLDAALIFFTAIPLIYAIIIYRRLLDYDDYHLPGNHKAFGFTAIEEGVEDRYSAYLSPPTPYDPTNPTLGNITTVTSGGETRGRSISIGSRRISLSFSRPVSVSPHPSPPLAAEVATPPPRPVSYDHKRDTEFETYMANRASLRSSRHSNGSSLYDDVHRALGDEFGFSDLPTPATADTKVGAVHAGQASRPRVASIGRQTSYEAVLAGAAAHGKGKGKGNGSGPVVVVTTPPEEGLRRGKSLNLRSVPEAHEEEDVGVGEQGQKQKQVNGGRRRAVSESQQALLGGEGEGGSVSGRDLVGGPRSGRASPALMERVEGLEDIELESRKRRRDS
ncbi:hypothetical protein GGR51DRAFT_225570 [Nemania sp. FL0031]|nr:hypothetical protein GGR51DRAFT_225570 [Nemania sp. FL0031]